MQLVAWNDYLKTGVDIIDQQHRGLVDLANEVTERLAGGATLSAEEARALLDFLVDYAEVHFNTEEALMALAGLDPRHTHHHGETHVRFMGQVEKMLAGARDRSEADDRRLVDFLGGWLIHHILGEDRAMARQLQAIGAGRRADQAFDEDLAAPPDPLRAAATRTLAQLHATLAGPHPQLPAPLHSDGTPPRPLTEVIAEHAGELAVSEAQFRCLFQGGKVPVLIMPLGADLLPAAVAEANPAACALLGYEPEEIAGLALADLVPADELARFPLLMSELLITGRFDCRMTHLAKGGRPIATRVSMAHLVLGGRLVTMATLQEAGARETPAAGEAAAGRRLPPRPHAGPLLELVPGPQEGGIDPAQAAALLRQHALFRDVAAADLGPLAADSRSRRLRKGEILFQHGDSPRGLFLVISGQIKLAVSSAQGNEKVVDVVGPRQVFGEAEVFMNHPYPVFAQALSHAVLLQAPQGELLDLLGRDSGFARRLVEHLGLRVHDLVRDVESFTMRSSTERVIGYLLEHAYINAKGKLETILPAQKQVIASLLHITPPTLSRIFQNLSEAGLMSVSGRYVTIPDPERLLACQAAEAAAGRPATPSAEDGIPRVGGARGG